VRAFKSMYFSKLLKLCAQKMCNISCKIMCAGVKKQDKNLGITASFHAVSYCVMVVINTKSNNGIHDIMSAVQMTSKGNVSAVSMRPRRGEYNLPTI
jgi:hypothetical protein